MSEKVVHYDQADGLFPIPHRRLRMRAAADDFGLVVQQINILLAERRRMLLVERFVGARSRDMADVPLVAQSAVLIRSPGSVDKPGLRAAEPDSQPVEAKPCASQLHRLPAHRVHGFGARKLIADFKQGPQPLLEQAFLAFAFPQRLLGPFPGTQIAEGGGEQIQEFAILLGDRPVPEQVVHGHVADDFLPVPHRRLCQRTMADDMVFPVAQIRIGGQERDRPGLVQDLQTQVRRRPMDPAFVDGAALRVGAERPVD